MRAIGLFSDLAYYPALVAAINSILHFRVRARIKVYDFNGLPHLARSYLARWAEVVPPPPEILGDHYREHWFYRPRFLAAAGIDPYELVLDADTVVLADLEEAFREIESGRVVAVREREYVHPDSLREWDDRDLPAESIFHRLLAHPEIYKESPLPIYNGGLLGFNREQHRFLIDLWRRTTACYDQLHGTFFALDQHSLSLLLASLRREGRIALHELPPELWMQTWARHREPRKLLAFEAGSPALYNGDLSRRMRFYHYTGDIVAPPELIGRDDPIPVRFGALVTDLGLPSGVTQRQMRESWHHVWRHRHHSPAGELPMFFYDLGPLRAPQCMDPAWRESLARLLGSPDEDSREVWALAFAYDYIEYLGYAAGDLGWLAPALRSLGADLARPGERTIAWESGADVAIGFQPRYEDRREWTGGEPAVATSPYAEHHRGVFLNVA
ncbi:MAG TPA: hypothetical protein VIC28_08720 [Thermoanaerobaculia bacterium]